MDGASQDGVMLREPTIKGIFVQSHVACVRRQRGDAGLDELRRRYGGPLRFRAMEDVPITDEVRLLEEAVQIMEGPMQGAFLDERAGRMHFNDFATTPWATVLFTMFPKDIRFMLLHARSIAERVFRHVHFEAEELDAHTVRVRFVNSRYPLDHFRGLLEAWMDHFNQEGVVVARQHPEGQEFVVRCA